VANVQQPWLLCIVEFFVMVQSLFFRGALCVGCKKVAARPEQVYCSDDCIKEYCEEIIKGLSNNSATPLKPDHRIPVMEKKTGRLLTGKPKKLSSLQAFKVCILFLLCFSQTQSFIII